MRAVVVFGAGVSAPFGVPTLGGLFIDPRSRVFLASNRRLLDHLDRHVWGPRGQTLESSSQSLNVEEVLTLLRDEEYLGKSSLAPEGIREFRRDLFCMIKHAIYDNRSTRGRHLNPLITTLDQRCEEVTWASFNWDCIFESSFYYWSGNDTMDRGNPNVVIALQGWRSSDPKHTFLKLHGGINWWYADNQVRYCRFGSDPTLDHQWAQYEAGSDEYGEPLILEPSYYKYTAPVFPLLQPQWRILLERLISADVVLVVGYSLPETDALARSTLTVAFQRNQSARWIVIDPSPVTCARFHRWFGTQRLSVYAQDYGTLAGQIEALLPR